jgi:hypothetical protein
MVLPRVDYFELAGYKRNSRGGEDLNLTEASHQNPCT